MEQNSTLQFSIKYKKEEKLQEINRLHLNLFSGKIQGMNFFLLSGWNIEHVS
jgi:hypothetical protein